jgi:putative ABC transport system permease protein
MITLKNISKIYQMENHSVEALRGVDLFFDQTGFVSIVGPSGCGKTTLLNIIGGLDHPTQGSLMIKETDTKDFKDSDWNSYRNAHVGFVFQSFYLIPHLSILENVMMPLKLAGLSAEEQEIRAVKALQSVKLESFIHHRPNQLSGGQQQRASIARALVNEPDIILADEPTGSLDHQSSVEVMNILKEISATRLVLMVTHNEALSQTYSDRILTMSDGLIISDIRLHEKNTSSATNTLHLNSSKMSIKTSFMLSLSNLRKRLYRTILIVLAASIGIMGMTLVIAVASGFDHFIELRKTETLNAFPIRVERVSAVVPFFDEMYQPNLPLFSNDDIIYPRNIQYEFQTINTLTPDYYDHVQLMDSSLYDSIYYNFGETHQFAVSNDGVKSVDDVFTELPVNASYLSSYFDLLDGRMPDDSKNEMVVVVDRYNRLSKDLVEKLGFSSSDLLSFDNLLSLEVKWLPNDIFYSFVGMYYQENDLVQTYQDTQSSTIPIVGIIRIKDDFNLDLLNTGFYYTSVLGNQMREDAAASMIVSDQFSTNNSVFGGLTFSTSAEKTSFLRGLGFSTYPIAYTIYSKSFEDKDEIMRYLRLYNAFVDINDQVEPLDIAGIGLSTMRIAIDATTVILLAFSLISLFISNLMIGIMTYTSVIERTKEIGILRAIGARKQDVGVIFYAETLCIGLLSGLLAIILSYVLIPVLNIFLESTTDIPHLSRLPLLYALGLIILSTLLTSISGIIPARIASKKDPILCLRNE